MIANKALVDSYITLTGLYGISVLYKNLESVCIHREQDMEDLNLLAIEAALVEAIDSLEDIPRKLTA